MVVAQNIADGNHGTGTTINSVTCSGGPDTTCMQVDSAARTITLNILQQLLLVTVHQMIKLMYLLL